MGNETKELIDVEGLVKWFDPRKGFGFIVGPDEQDIFVHYTIIEGDGFRVLADGSPVIYNAENGDKGWRATKVVALDTPKSPDDDSGDTDTDPNSDPDDAPEVVVNKRTYSRTPHR